MSEPKLISPMLDNFAMGDPISSHNGIQCCPAMANDTEQKYIVKIISVPANTSQIDALLLSGAYQSREDALKYFCEISNEILQEVDTLRHLSELDGFLTYEDQQLVAMDNDAGYDVYLLSPYRRSLEKLQRSKTLTHLSALNLGLDICSALSACRRNGLLYVNLKPENIYYSPDHGFRIGDIGFIRQDALQYASLPERYRSSYTAPEIADAFSTLNDTLDVYALGLILYQIFNGGVLPQISAEQALPTPEYADYEIAEIILKACNPEPSARWNTPAEMGQALVSYMQRNGAHDTLIVPCIMPDEAEESPVEQPVEDQVVIVSTETAPSETADTPDDNEQPQDASIADDETNKTVSFTEDEDGNLSFLLSEEDETLPGLEDADVTYEAISQDVTEILNQADELIAHPTPEPAVAPDPIDVPIPSPIVLEDAAETADESNVEEDDTMGANDVPIETAETDLPDITDDAHAPSIDDSQCPCDTEAAPIAVTKAPAKKHVLRNVLLAILALLLIIGGVLFYRFYYLQSIESMAIAGSNSNLTVYVTTDVPYDQLQVVCSDTYGNKHTQPVVDGVATFTELAPATAYTVKVEIDGFHKLIGSVTKSYTTPAVTTISQFTALTGQEDGTAILTFTTEGPGTDKWKIDISGEDGANRSEVFTGHMLTLSGLNVGSTYTFKLSPVDDIYIAGDQEITHTASKIILAENLSVNSCINSELTVSWDAPADTTVANWIVRCFNDKGYDETVITEETNLTFLNITDTDNYTIDVTAVAMSVSQRYEVTANSITLTDFKVNTVTNNYLTLVWSSANATAEQQWIVQYQIDGSAVYRADVGTSKTCQIPLVPGATYSIELVSKTNESVLGGKLKYATSAADNFSGYNVKAENIEFKMCQTPDDSNWNRYDVDEFTTTFKIGQKASFLARMRKSYSVSYDNITTMYVIRDAEGKVVSFETENRTWVSMWYNGYGEFNVPSLPGTTGNYQITIYFNGKIANQVNFNITN